MSESEAPSVLVRTEGRVGRLTLNRARALNALDRGMIDTITQSLLAWRKDPHIHAVVVDATGEKAFCAGGDIRAIRDAALRGDGAWIHDFFGTEYAMNRLIAEYPKPYIALIDGICMGGGIGISVHGRMRVASENALFAMPETGIALFPDVGGSYFLPRLPGELGLYLGLTGARLKGADAVHAGFATHFVPRARFAELTAALVEQGASALAGFTEALPAFSLAPHMAAINRAFSAPRVEEIFARLEHEGAFGAETLAALRAASPSAVLWSFGIITAGRGRELPECLAAELKLTAHVTAHPDFAEGVRAMIIDKDRTPRWSPAALEEVDQDLIGRMLG